MIKPQASAAFSEILIQGPFQYPTTMELFKDETLIALSSKEQLFKIVWNHTAADDSILIVYIRIAA